MSQKVLRAGVVCEGPTDYHAIESFVGAAFNSAQIPVRFIPLQPQMDETQPQGGWTLVERWFRDNSPELRVRRYFGGGLFDADLDAKACDFFIIQMDTDILDDAAFRNIIQISHGLAIGASDEPSDRAETIKQILRTWSAIESCCEADRKRHIFAPAVESTETWCVAAFGRTDIDLERLRGEHLRGKFMEVLLMSESRRDSHTSSIDKNVHRRRIFCEKHAVGVDMARNQCRHFDLAVREALALSV